MSCPLSRRNRFAKPCLEPEKDPAPTSQIGSTAASPSETRSLYCSRKGPVDRGNGERPGIALDLPESQGVFLVEKGLATTAVFLCRHRRLPFGQHDAGEHHP